MNMHNSTKVAHSSAIRAEVKRHESLQKTFNKVLKQLERVEDQQLRTGLKVYIHGVQGESTWCLLKQMYTASLFFFLLHDNQFLQDGKDLLECLLKKKNIHKAYFSRQKYV